VGRFTQSQAKPNLCNLIWRKIRILLSAFNRERHDIVCTACIVRRNLGNNLEHTVYLQQQCVAETCELDILFCSKRIRLATIELW
jgi:hypothetical protein